MDYSSDSALLWAFAIDTTRPRDSRRRKLPMPRYNLERFQLTSCSPRLREVGVGSGMLMSDAKQLAPDMRVIICNR